MLTCRSDRWIHWSRLLVMCLERHSSMDRSAKTGSRLDGQLAVHQVYPFPHTDKPQTSIVDSRLLVKADSMVAHAKLNFVQFSPQFNSEAPGAAMLQRILQGFLQDPEQTE